MQESAAGVKRLLRTIYQNADENNIKTLARLLNYHEQQLRQDIEAINLVNVTDKEGAQYGNNSSN